MDGIAWQILYAIGVAIVYGLANYFHKTPREEFSWPMFVKTLIIGACIGYVQYATGMTYDQALAWLAENAIILYFIDKIVNALFQFFPKRL